MEKTLVVIAIGVLSSVSAMAGGQSPATIRQMTAGVAQIRTSIGDGDFAAASKGLGGLYENGGGGFAKTAEAVDASEANSPGYTGEYTASSDGHEAITVPPPLAAKGKEETESEAWRSALAAVAGGLGTFLLLARAGNTTPDGTPPPPRENPSGDRDVQRGFDENQRRQRENRDDGSSGQENGRNQAGDDRRRRPDASDLVIELLRNMQEEN